MKDRDIVKFYTKLIRPWTQEEIDDYCKLKHMPIEREDRVKYRFLQEFLVKNPGLFMAEDVAVLNGIVFKVAERLEEEKQEGSYRK